MADRPQVGQDAESEFAGALARVESRAAVVREKVVALVTRLGWPDEGAPSIARVERAGYMAALGTIEYALDEAQEALDRCQA